MSLSKARGASWSPGSLLRAAGSYRLSVVLMLSWLGLLLVWVAPFQVYGLPEGQLQAIVRSEPFFKVLYALFVVNALACLVVRLPSVVRRATHVPRGAAAPSVPDAAITSEAVFDSASASRAMTAAGFRHVVAGEGWVWGVRNRWAPLGTLVLHAALLVLFAGGVLFYGPGGAFVAKATVAEQESFTGEPEAYIEVSRGEVEDAPALTFVVEGIEPRFHDDILLFTRLDSLLRKADGNAVRMSLANPWFAAMGTLVAIEDFGYAPVVKVGENSTVYRTSTFPSGTSDTIEIQGTDSTYRLDIQVFGDYFEREGQPASRSFNLAEPRMLVSVRRVLTNGAEATILRDELVGLGEPLNLGQDRIVFDDIAYYGVFRILRSPALPVMAAGLLLAAVGACMRLVFPRAEALVARDAAGQVRVVVRRDVYGLSASAAERLEGRLGR